MTDPVDLEAERQQHQVDEEESSSEEEEEDVGLVDGIRQKQHGDENGLLEPMLERWNGRGRTVVVSLLTTSFLLAMAVFYLFSSSKSVFPSTGEEPSTSVSSINSIVPKSKESFADSSMDSTEVNDSSLDKSKESSSSSTGIPAYPLSSYDTSYYTFTTADQLLHDIASVSIDIMRQDTVQTLQQQHYLDITAYVQLFQVALDHLGLDGILDGFLEVRPFVKAFNDVAKARNLTTRANDVHFARRSNMVKYTNLLSDRILDEYPVERCTGCLWWLRHYSGAIAVNQFLRDGFIWSGPANSTSRRRLELPAEIYAQLRRMQRLLGRPEQMVIDFGHGFVYQLVAETMPDLEEFPLQLAKDLCGDLLGTSTYYQGIKQNVGFECHHGFGHAIWAVLANREFGRQPVHMQPFPRGSLVFREETKCQGVRLCLSAPGDFDEHGSVAFGCIRGYAHSIASMGNESVGHNEDVLKELREDC